MTNRLRNGVAWFFLFCAGLVIVVNSFVLSLGIAWAVYAFAGLAVINLLAAAWIMLFTPIVTREQFDKMYYDKHHRKGR